MEQSGSKRQTDRQDEGTHGARPFRHARTAPAIAAVLALALLSISPGTLSRAAAQASQDASVDEPNILDRRAHGAAALDALGGRLTEAARRNDMTPAVLRRILQQDDSAWLDRDGRLSYFDEAPPSPRPAVPSPRGPFPYSLTFLLHSRPEANRVIYLDFNGQNVTGTRWNDERGLPAGNYPSFDIDGNPGSFSNAEQDIIQGVWQRVAEDFAPFFVDVTTEQPPADDIERSSFFDLTYGTRVLISSSPAAHNVICPAPADGPCGGRSYVGIFDDYQPNLNTYSQPAWVFPQQLGNNEKSIAEAASHEAGHNAGLNHDGIASPPQEYYGGHGAWAPIMGVGYNRPIVQWSKGEYNGANNFEDDIDVMRQNGVVVANDDHANQIGGSPAATNLGTGGTGGALDSVGIVETRTDVDAFQFTQTCTGGTIVSVSGGYSPTSPNLDAQMRIVASNGALIRRVDPPSAFVSADEASGLTAATTVGLAPGTYGISVEGVAFGDPGTTGYSDYASIGSYGIHVRTCAEQLSIGGVVRDSNGNRLGGARVTLIGQDRSVITNALGGYSFNGLSPRTRYSVNAQRLCKGVQQQSVTVNGEEELDFTLPSASNCEVRTQAWVDGTTTVAVSGDDASAAVTLPFPYRHYGTDYSTVHISTNGFVNFLGPSTAFDNGFLPSSAAPNAALYPFWDDLVVDASSVVRRATVGTAPNRRFVIEWRNVAILGDLARRFDVEIILPEDRNQRVLFQYRGIDNGTVENGDSATVGTENAAGDKANLLQVGQGLIFDGLTVAPK